MCERDSSMLGFPWGFGDMGDSQGLDRADLIFAENCMKMTEFGIFGSAIGGKALPKLLRGGPCQQGEEDPKASGEPTKPGGFPTLPQ